MSPNRGNLKIRQNAESLHPEIDLLDRPVMLLGAVVQVRAALVEDRPPQDPKGRLVADRVMLSREKHRLASGELDPTS